MDLLKLKLFCGPGCSNPLAIASVVPAKLAAFGRKEIPWQLAPPLAAVSQRLETEGAQTWYTLSSQRGLSRSETGCWLWDISCWRTRRWANISETGIPGSLKEREQIEQKQNEQIEQWGYIFLGNCFRYFYVALRKIRMHGTYIKSQITLRRY